MKYMNEPMIPELEHAPELGVMYILDHNLKALENAVCATDRKLFDDWESKQPAPQSATIHLCNAILDYCDALRHSLAAYQKSINTEKNADALSAIF